MYYAKRKNKLSIIIILITLAIFMMIGVTFFYIKANTTKTSLELTQSVENNETANLRIYYPKEYQISTSDNQVEIKGDGVLIKINDPLLNLEGFSFDLLSNKIDQMGIINSKKVASTNLNSSQGKIHKTTYHSFTDQIVVRYACFFEDLYVIGTVTYSNKKALKINEKTIDNIFSKLIGTPFEEDETFITNNNAFKAPMYEPTNYAFLSKSYERKVYNQMLETLKNFTEKSFKVESDYYHERSWVDYSVWASGVCEDYPEYEIFCFNYYGPDVKRDIFSKNYKFKISPLWTNDNLDVEEMKKVFAEIETQAHAIINAMPKELTIYGKYKYLAEAVSALAEYDMIAAELPYNSETYIRRETAASIYGVFINKKATCRGYAKAFKYLSSKAGLYNKIVGTDTHAFNIIKLYDGTYYVDSTWGVKAFSHDNFALTYNDIQKDEARKNIRGENNIATGKIYESK